MRHPHRAWAVCLGGIILLFTVMGLVTNVFSVYQPYIIQFNGFSNAQGSWITTVRSLFVLVGMMTANHLCAKLGLRRTVTLSMGLVALSCLVFGLAQTFPAYCGAAALGGLGYSWGGMIPLSLLVDRWFQDQQAFALGLASAGSGLATILMPSPLTWLIEDFGLATAFWCEGTFVLALTLAVWLLVRDCPEELGLTPYRRDGQSAVQAPEHPAPAGMTRTRWAMVLLAVFLMGGPTSLGVSHVGVLYTTEGYDPATVAALVSTMGICVMLGKVIFGKVVDRLGGRLSNYIIYGVSLTSFLLCCLAPLGGNTLAFATMLLFGLGMPVSNISLSVWSKDFQGDAGFARGLKHSQTLYALGILLFGPVPGMLADRLGSYVPAYGMFFCMMLISMLLLSYVYETTKAGAKPTQRV